LKGASNKYPTLYLLNLNGKLAGSATALFSGIGDNQLTFMTWALPLLMLWHKMVGK